MSELARAVQLSGAHLFDPSSRRPMREWVVIPVEHAGQWQKFGRAALTYVAGEG